MTVIVFAVLGRSFVCLFTDTSDESLAILRRESFLFCFTKISFFFISVFLKFESPFQMPSLEILL